MSNTCIIDIFGAFSAMIQCHWFIDFCWLTARQWMEAPQGVSGIPPGLEYMSSLDQLIVKQRIEFGESKKRLLSFTIVCVTYLLLVWGWTIFLSKCLEGSTSKIVISVKGRGLFYFCILFFIIIFLVSFVVVVSSIGWGFWDSFIKVLPSNFCPFWVTSSVEQR